MNRGVAVLTAMALSACGGGVSVKSDFDPAAAPAMRAYKTYTWAVQKRDQNINNLAKQRITTAVDAALVAKGYTKAASGGDFLVAYIASTSQQTDYTTTSDYYGYGWGRWYGGMGATTSRTTATNWTQGTLVIDIVDGKSNEMVFRTTGQAEIDQDMTPDERQARLNAAAVQMLANFPPK